MLKISQLFLVAATSALLVACSGGTSSTASTNNTGGTGGTGGGTSTPTVASVTVGGVAANPASPIVVKYGQTVVVKMSASVDGFSTSSTLNGLPAATQISGPVGVPVSTSTSWSASVDSTPGTVMTMKVIYLGSIVQTLTFDVQSDYQGKWNASYTGGDAGTCTGFTVGKDGAISGACTSTALGGAVFSISGAVTASGVVNFVGGSASTGATFVGYMIAPASGTWKNTSYSPALTGYWTATKI
jgi:hypothetical protein